MKIGTDKFAHAGLSAMAVALFTIVVILQETQPCRGYLLYALMMAALIFIFGLFKEYVIDETPDMGDIIADAIGCALIPVAVLFGTLLSIWSH